jgi:hypothetical protein
MILVGGAVSIVWWENEESSRKKGTKRMSEQGTAKPRKTREGAGETRLQMEKINGRIRHCTIHKAKTNKEERGFGIPDTDPARRASARRRLVTENFRPELESEQRERAKQSTIIHFYPAKLNTTDEVITVASALSWHPANKQRMGPAH